MEFLQHARYWAEPESPLLSASFLKRVNFMGVMSSLCSARPPGGGRGVSLFSSLSTVIAL